MYPGYGGITQQENATNGNYSGFQTGVRVQNRWGLSGELDYTWSHEIDIMTYDNSCCVGNPWYLKYDKGSGTLDRRNMLNANYIYKMPFFAHSNGLVKSILGGWEIAGTVIDESGVPVPTSLSGADTIGLGGGYSNRPNVSGKMKYVKKVNAFWQRMVRHQHVLASPSCMGLAVKNQGFGNAGKDAVVGLRRQRELRRSPSICFTSRSRSRKSATSNCASNRSTPSTTPKRTA